MAKPLLIFWSLAASKACSADLDNTQSFVLSAVGALAAKMDGWFFHTFTAPGGQFLRCDAHLETDKWRVYVRTAQLVGEPTKYPEAIKASENEKFAEFWELRKHLPER